MKFTYPKFQNGRFPLSIFFFFFLFSRFQVMRKEHILARRRPYFLRACHKLRACLHGGGGPHVGEVTRLGGVTHPSI